MQNKKKLNLVMLTSLVAGNMIGSGVFLLPSDLARIGSIGIFSWLVTFLGAASLAFVFAKMSILVPKGGGPYVYAKHGFGEFMGFQTAYNHWLATWIGNAAIVVALIGYLSVFFPILQNQVYFCLSAVFTVWLLPLVNMCNVKFVGNLATCTTTLKLLPLLAVGIFGWQYFHWHHITGSFNVSGTSNISAIMKGASITLWAFIGVESATVAANEAENPERNIPIATCLGTLIAGVVYIFVSFVIIGMIPNKELAFSVSPYALAARTIFGKYGEYIIAGGAVISVFGTLSGWILVQGQIAAAAASDGIFPKIFAIKNKVDSPVVGLIITSTLITILLLLTVSKDLIKQFELIVLMVSLTSLLPYLYTVAAYLITDSHGKVFIGCDKLNSEKCKLNKKKAWEIVVAIIAGVYSLFAICGISFDIFFYGSILMLLSVPIYIAMKMK